MDAFIPKRAELYAKRKCEQVSQLQKDLTVLSNKAKFIEYNLNDTIDLRRKTDKEVNDILEKHEFDKKDGNFNYLRKMPMDTVTKEKAEQLLKERDDKSNELVTLQSMTEKQIWINELDTLLCEYKKYVELRSHMGEDREDDNVGGETKKTKLKIKKSTQAKKNIKV